MNSSPLSELGGLSLKSWWDVLRHDIVQSTRTKPFSSFLVVDPRAANTTAPADRLTEMVKHGFDVESYVQKTGDNALHIATSRNALGTVQKLLRLNANVNAKNINGTTALMKACKAQKIDMVKKLLQETGIEVNSKNNNGDTALVISLRYGNTETENIPLQLLRCGAHTSDDSISGERGENPLFLASRFGSPVLLRSIMKRRGVDGSGLHPEGGKIDPLLNCIRFNQHVDSIIYLIETLFSTNNAKNDENEACRVTRTHFDAVQSHRAPNEIERIARAMRLASGTKKAQSAIEEEGALMLNACASGDITALRSILASTLSESETFSLVNYSHPKTGVTPLISASKQNSSDVVKHLVKSGANLHAAERQSGLTSLHWTARNGNSSAIKVLLKYGADPNVQCTKKNTALHYAVSNKNMAAAEALLSHLGINCDIRNEKGETVLMIAMAFNHAKLVSTLMVKDSLTKGTYISMKKNLENKVTLLEDEVLRRKRANLKMSLEKKQVIERADERVNEVEDAAKKLVSVLDFFTLEKKRMRGDDAKAYLGRLGYDVKSKELKKKKDVLDALQDHIQQSKIVLEKGTDYKDGLKLGVPEQDGV